MFIAIAGLGGIRGDAMLRVYALRFDFVRHRVGRLGADRYIGRENEELGGVNSIGGVSL